MKKKQRQSRAFIKTPETPTIYHVYEPGDAIIAQKTKHSGIAPGSKGVILARHPDGGYAVEFEVVARISLFGGATYTEPAIIYLEPHEFIKDATQLHKTAVSGSNGETPTPDVAGGPIVNDSGQGGA